MHIAPRWARSVLPVFMVLLLLYGCSPQQGTPTVSHTLAPASSPAQSPVPTATPRPTPTPVPTPTATPRPTPTPIPTPTPDPWEEHFASSGVVMYNKSPDKGPWIYQDSELSINITKQSNKRKQVCFIAEIYTRGPLFFGGFPDKAPKARKTRRPYYIARQYQAVLGLTGDYLTHHENPKGVMLRGGKIYYDRKDTDTLAMLPDGEMRIYSPGEITAQELADMGVQDSFTFGPVLVRDGKINEKAKKHELRRPNERTTIGMVEKGHYYCIVTEGEYGFDELAQMYVDLGCTVAYNLDGGNSAAMVFMGDQLNFHAYNEQLKCGQRSLPDLIMIGSSPMVPDPKAPVYNDGQTKHKKYKPH